jgi:hypothetical protein
MTSAAKEFRGVRIEIERDGSALRHDNGRYGEVLVAIRDESERAHLTGLGVDEDIHGGSV